MSAQYLITPTRVATQVGQEDGQFFQIVKVINFLNSNLISYLNFILISAICSGADVTGKTIKTNCELNGKTVSCNQQHLVGTVAFIECGPFYDMPKELSHLSKKLTCQSSGSWDKLALRCLPRCGRITQLSTAYVVNGRKAKNIGEVPWTAAIYKRDVLICGGSIISERLIKNHADSLIV